MSIAHSLHERTISLRFQGHILESFQTWRFRTQCLHYKPVSTHFCWGGGGWGELNPLVEVTVKEENSSYFCPNCVQEFGLCTAYLRSIGDSKILKKGHRTRTYMFFTCFPLIGDIYFLRNKSLDCEQVLTIYWPMILMCPCIIDFIGGNGLRGQAGGRGPWTLLGP
jgi:hypothetical protein